MKFIIVLACVATIAVASPLEREHITHAPLLRHEESHSAAGHNIEFEIADGTQVRDHAVRAEGPEGEVFYRHEGSYKYLSPEGETVEVHYKADELGFRAQGTHIPKVIKA